MLAARWPNRLAPVAGQSCDLAETFRFGFCLEKLAALIKRTEIEAGVQKRIFTDKWLGSSVGRAVD